MKSSQECTHEKYKSAIDYDRTIKNNCIHSLSETESTKPNGAPAEFQLNVNVDSESWKQQLPTSTEWERESAHHLEIRKLISAIIVNALQQNRHAV